jgi:hypothetical protein
MTITFRRVVLAILLCALSFVGLIVVPGMPDDLRSLLLGLAGAAVSFLVGWLTKPPGAE